MTFHARRKCGRWAVYLTSNDGPDVMIYEGNKKQCQAEAERLNKKYA